MRFFRNIELIYRKRIVCYSEAILTNGTTLYFIVTEYFLPRHYVGEKPDCLTLKSVVLKSPLFQHCPLPTPFWIWIIPDPTFSNVCLLDRRFDWQAVPKHKRKFFLKLKFSKPFKPAVPQSMGRDKWIKSVKTTPFHFNCFAGVNSDTVSRFAWNIRNNQGNKYFFALNFGWWLFFCYSTKIWTEHFKIC